MDRKLINYLPPVLREVAEFKAINNANEPEISLAWDGLDRVMANQFLDDADEQGVSVWERELKIRPKDTDTLAIRKARVKALWNLKTPYTIPWLRQWMTGVFGEGRHSETLEDYTLTIRLLQDLSADTRRKTEEFFKTLLNVIPENILLSLDYLFPEAALPIPILTAPGPRVSCSAPPQYRARLGPGRIPAAYALGTRYSRAAPPMAAYTPLG